MSVLANYACAGEWQLSAHKWQNTEQHELDENVERHAYGGAYLWGEPDNKNKVTYEHQAILVRAGEPGSNGYFHRLDTTIGHTLGSLQLNVTLGVHASSNMFQKVEFHSEAWVGSYSVRYPLGKIQVGINGDYRFDNRFRYYPIIASNWTLKSDVELVMDLPVRIAVQGVNHNWQLSVQRYGDKWAALHNETDIKSATYFGEWQLQGKVRVLQGSAYSLYLLAGWSFDSEIRYLDLTQGQLSAALEKCVFAGIEASF